MAAKTGTTGSMQVDTDLVRELAAMLNDINPSADNRGPVEFKRHVAGVILGRAIARAWSRT